MSNLLTERGALSGKQLLVFVSLLLLFVNLSGDHVFNKVNNLKVFLVLISVSLLGITVLFSIRSYNYKLLVFLSFPLIAALPGFISTDFQYMYGSYFEITSQTLCIVWAFFLYSCTSSLKDSDIWKVVWVFIPALYFVCFIAILEKLGLDPLTNIPLNPYESSWLSKVWEYKVFSGRVESTFGNINYFASFLIQLLPLIIGLFLIYGLRQEKSEYRSIRCAIGGAILLSLVCLLFTQTRAAIFAFMLSACFFVLLLFKVGLISKRMIMGLGFSSLFIIIILFILMVSFDIDRFQSLLNKATWWPRTVSWQAAWLSIQSAPIFGHGIGASYQLFFEYVAADSRLFSGSRSYNHVHNEILQVLQEGGFFGLIVYVLFWSIPILWAIKNSLDDKYTIEIRILLSALVCGLLAYHIHGLFSVAPRMISSRLIAYSMLAIVLNIIWKQSDKRSFSSSKYSTRLSLFITLVVILSAIFNYLLPFLSEQNEYASSLASLDRQSRIEALAVDSSNVYVLEEAAKQAFDDKNASKLFELTNKSKEIFTHYREMDVYHSYGLFWQGNVKEAYSEINSYQMRDRYNSLANILLLSIALRRSSENEFLIQLQKALEFQACRNKLMDCDNLNINIVTGRFSNPFQIIEKGDKWNVLLDKSLFLTLQQQASELVTDRDSELTYQMIVRLLSRGTFFRPNAVSSDPLTPKDYANLALYLKYLNKDVEGRNDEILRLESKLREVMNLESYLQSRELLLGISNTLFSSIDLMTYQ